MKNHNVIHRLLSIFISAVFIFTMTASLPAYADENSLSSETYSIKSLQFGYLQDSSFESAYSSIVKEARSVSFSTADEAIENAIKNLKTTVNLSLYGLTVQEVFTAFENVINDHPEYYYISNNVQVYYSRTTELAVQAVITYKYTNDEIEQMNETFNKEVDYIISTIDADAMSDIEIALAVHEYFTVHFTYDYTYSIFDAYSIIVNKTGVCQAYALAYRYVLNKMGLECEVVTSDEINHAWNVVKIGDTYYYVDTTWDDCYLTMGKSSHNNFMQDETGIVNLGHTGMKQTYTADDNSYDYFFWTNIKNGMVYYDGLWYFIDDANNYLKTYNFETNKINTLFKADTFIDSSTLYSNVAEYNGIFYYNNDDTIYEFDSDGGDIRTVFELSDDEDSKIYGIAVYKGQLVYTLKEAPQDDDELYYLSFEDLAPITSDFTETTMAETTSAGNLSDESSETTSETDIETTNTETEETSSDESFMYGDVNGDMTISISDVIILTRFLYGSIELNEEEAKSADIVTDNRLNIFDLAAIKALIY